MGFGKVWGWTSGVHCDIYSMGSVIKPDDEQFLVVTAKFTSTLAMLIVSAKTVATAMVLIMKWPTFDPWATGWKLGQPGSYLKVRVLGFWMYIGFRIWGVGCGIYNKIFTI